MSLGLILLLYVVGLGLVALEVFIPGMIVGIIGFLCGLTAIGLAFWHHGLVPGVSLIGSSFVGGYGIFSLAVRKMALRDTQSRDEGYSAVEPGLDELVGEQGLTECPLRPVGTARFGERPITVVTRGEMIEAGQNVEVIEVEGNRVVVKRLG